MCSWVSGYRRATSSSRTTKPSPHLTEHGIHVDRVPQDGGVDDQAKSAETAWLAVRLSGPQTVILITELIQEAVYRSIKI